MNAEKSQLRTKAKKLLKKIPREEWAENSFAIMQKLAQNSHFKDSERIFVYLPSPTEPDTLPLIEQFFGEKKFFVWDGQDIVELIEPKYKMAEFPFPLPKKCGELGTDLDLVILPGLLFDKQNQRLGHGTGWCDCFLRDKDFYKIALCLDCQIVDTLPCEPHDVGFDEIITEK